MNFNILFKSLDARRMGSIKAHVNINNNSTIVAVTRDGGVKMSIGFVFSSTYEPNIGVIRIEGDLEVEDSAESIDLAVKEWEGSGKSKLPKDMAETIHNTILSNCVVEASILARDVKLPSPIPMPHVTIGDKETDTSYIR